MNQQQLDYEMSEAGKKRYMENIQSAVDRGEESVTPYGRRLISHYIDPVSKAIKSRIKQSNDAYEHIKVIRDIGITYDQMSLIGLSLVVDYLHRSPTYNSMVFRIAARVQDEHRYNYLRRAAPTLFNKLVKQLKGQLNQQYFRKREIVVLAMNRTEAEQGGYTHNGKFVPPFPKWSIEVTMRVGAMILLAIQQHTDLFKVELEPTPRGHFRKIITASEETLNWISKFNGWFAMTKPMWLPTVEKPLEWSNPFGGGYTGEQLATLPLVKTTDNKYLTELVGVEMPEVYKAVNALQSTPWKVNKTVLEVAKKVWNQGHGGLAGLPSRLDPIEEYLPPKPHDIDTNKEARSAWRKEAAKVHSWYREEKGRNIQTANTLNLAIQFQNEEQFYLPNQLDFRGRTYTVPAFLTPQGTDLAKGLLLFAKGKKVEHQSGADWLAIAGANLYGIDKVNYDERIAWTLNHRKEIEHTVQDPYTNKWWQEADGGDSAFQFLAWCYEWVGYLKQGYEYVTHIPIALDASNNGLQLLSLLCRDEVSGLSTNCLPTESPEDIYSDVAVRVKEKLEVIADASKPQEAEGMARFWLNYGISRKTCKRPVMVFPYGGTKQSCMEYVRDWFQDEDRSRAKTGDSSGFSERQQFDHAVFLAHLVWDSLTELVDRPKHVMEWLQKAALRFVEAKKPMTWIVPTGLKIKQDYRKSDGRVVELRISSSKMLKISGRQENDKLNPRRMKNGISPNFVHSLDAAILHICVAQAADMGVDQFAMVHDSYGVLPADTDVMAAVVRHVFKKVFSEDQLQIAKDYWEEILGEELDPLPEYGSMDINKIIESEYLFS